MPTKWLNVPTLTDDQVQKDETVNEAFSWLDAIVPAVVASASTRTPPPSPEISEAYLVPFQSSFPGVRPGEIAIWRGGGWVAAHAVIGQRVFVLDEGRYWIYSMGASHVLPPLGPPRPGHTLVDWVLNPPSPHWVPGDVVSRGGFTTGLCVRDFEVTTTGGPSVRIQKAFRMGEIVCGVTSLNIERVTGPGFYKIHDDINHVFGSRVPGDRGNSQNHLVTPYATPSGSLAPLRQLSASDGGDLVLSAEDGATAFTGGRVGLTVHVIQLGIVSATSERGGG